MAVREAALALLQWVLQWMLQWVLQWVLHCLRSLLHRRRKVRGVRGEGKRGGAACLRVVREVQLLGQALLLLPLLLLALLLALQNEVRLLACYSAIVL